MDGAGQNNRKTIRTRSGVLIRMDDSTGQQRLPYPDTHEHEPAGHVTRDGTSRQQARACVHVRDEEVEASPQGSWTSTFSGLPTRRAIPGFRAC